MFAIVDIETTGGNTKKDKITEIAIFVHDGSKIQQEYSTLINPETRIPYHITQLTGINDSMVSNAPKFYEVASEIVKLTKDCTFVAHNVSFDYNFIREEFKSLGYQFQLPKLCTVKLSRKLIPGLESYSLGKLCKSLEIPINHRHRAGGDALATVKLFELLISNDKNNFILNGGSGLKLPSTLNSHLKPKDIDSLPNSTGVYYFFNKENELIYVGKSKKIRSRVIAHLNNFDNKKAMDMREEIARIEFEVTGSELISMLFESAEIKKHRPFYNRKSLKKGGMYGLYADLMIDGFLHLKISKVTRVRRPIATFSDNRQGKSVIEGIIDSYQLCPRLCGFDFENATCLYALQGKCDGNCQELSKQEAYNDRVMEAISTFQFDYTNFLIVEEGRHDNENAIVKIQNGSYAGYSFYSSELPDSIDDPANLGPFKKQQADNWEVRQLIRGYLKKNKSIRLFPF